MKMPFNTLKKLNNFNLNLKTINKRKKENKIQEKNMTDEG